MLLGNGYLFSTGSNAYGELGNGTTSSRTSWSDVAGENGIRAVSAGGSYACSLRPDGSVRCWGANYSGQLGNGTTSNSSVPVLVNGLTASVLGLGGGSFALGTDGKLFGWGTGGSGGALVPTLISLPGVTLTALGSARGSSQCAIATNTDVYCWGDNFFGQLGDGTMNNALTPIRLQLQ